MMSSVTTLGAVRAAVRALTAQPGSHNESHVKITIYDDGSPTEMEIIAPAPCELRSPGGQ